MKLLLALLILVASHCAAQETYVVMTKDSQFNADGMRMTLKTGECFPFIRWQPGNIWAVVNIHGYEVQQAWDSVRLVIRSREVDDRFAAAIVRLNQEHEQLLAARQKAEDDRARKQHSDEDFLKWYAEIRAIRQGQAAREGSAQLDEWNRRQRGQDLQSAEDKLRQLQNQQNMQRR